VARESDQEQRDRKDAETSEYRIARQLRLGHISDETVEEESVPKPKSKAAPRKKTT
jgi:hypothetical protein